MKMLYPRFSLVLALLLMAQPAGASLPPFTTASPLMSQGRAITTHAAIYACFDRHLAMRMGYEVSRGKLHDWMIGEFKAGTCLALPARTRLFRLEGRTAGGQRFDQFQVAGSTQWLYAPDWSSYRAVRRTTLDKKAQQKRKAFSAMLPVTSKLIAYTDQFLTCGEEIDAYNELAIAFNERVEEESKPARRSVSNTSSPGVRFSLDPERAHEARELRKRGNNLRKQCRKYTRLSAHPDFVSFVEDYQQRGLKP